MYTIWYVLSLERGKRNEQKLCRSTSMNKMQGCTNIFSSVYLVVFMKSKTVKRVIILYLYILHWTRVKGFCWIVVHLHLCALVNDTAMIEFATPHLGDGITTSFILRFRPSRGQKKFKIKLVQCYFFRRNFIE